MISQFSSRLDLKSLDHVLLAEPETEGYRILLFARQNQDEFYDVLRHSLLLRTAEQAQSLIARIEQTAVVNLQHWVWEIAPDSKILPKWRPTAQLQTSLAGADDRGDAGEERPANVGRRPAKARPTAPVLQARYSGYGPEEMIGEAWNYEPCPDPWDDDWQAAA